MGVLVACKNEDDLIKNEGARVVTTLLIDFSDTQGQLTQKSEMDSCRNSNSSKLLWVILLPSRIKKIHPKMKAQEWSQHSPIISLCGFLQTLKGRLLISPLSDLA